MMNEVSNKIREISRCCSRWIGDAAFWLFSVDQRKVVRVI